MTRAPAVRAMSTVASVEPKSTTTISEAMPDTAASVSASRSASFRVIRKTDKPGSGAVAHASLPPPGMYRVGGAAQPGGGPNTSTALSPPNANEFDMV